MLPIPILFCIQLGKKSDPFTIHMDHLNVQWVQVVLDGSLTGYKLQS